MSPSNRLFRRKGLSPSVKIRATATLVLNDLQQDSRFFQENAPRTVPRFEPSEVCLGDELGSGEFGIVYEVRALLLDKNIKKGKPVEDEKRLVKPVSKKQEVVPLHSSRSPKSIELGTPKHRRTGTATSVTLAEDLAQSGAGSTDNNHDERQVSEPDNGKMGSSIANDCDNCDDSLRLGLSKACQRKGTARYALKRLHEGTSHQELMDAAIDLSCEAKYLQSIVHPNIVRLRGTVGDVGSKYFGILLDRLVSTLDDKIKEWRQMRQPMLSSLLLFCAGGYPNLADELLAEKLLIVLDLARAMKFLHQNKLLYRDLKPENIGFNVRGDVQIFDFGLAKELKDKDRVRVPPSLRYHRQPLHSSGSASIGNQQHDHYLDDWYEATGLTGSRRYMAPEVVRCFPYGLSADVYSYGLVVWEVFSLRPPFADMNTRQHLKQVVMRGTRPYISKLSVRSRSLQQLIEACWADAPMDRPSFRRVCQLLKGEIATNESKLEKGGGQVIGKKTAPKGRGSQQASTTCGNNRRIGAVSQRTSHLLNRSFVSQQEDESTQHERQ